MPDKRYKRGCGPECIKCWVNRLKHGNEATKAYLKAHSELSWNVKHGDDNSSEPPAEPIVVDQVDPVDEAYILERQKETRQKEKDRRKKVKELMRSFPQEIREELF